MALALGFLKEHDNNIPSQIEISHTGHTEANAWKLKVEKLVTKTVLIWVSLSTTTNYPMKIFYPKEEN